MKLPRKDKVAGQVLRLMLDGKPRTKLEITEALGLHPAKEVTARLRDYRKDAPDGFCLDVQRWSERRDGQLVYLYQIRNAPAWMLEEVRHEKAREYRQQWGLPVVAV